MKIDVGVDRSYLKQYTLHNLLHTSVTKLISENINDEARCVDAPRIHKLDPSGFNS